MAESTNINTLTKPTLPKNCSKWWKLPVAELTDSQKEMKRKYHREYNKWHYHQDPEKHKKAVKRSAKKTRNVSCLTNKECTEEELEKRREIGRIHDHNRRKKAKDYDSLKEDYDRLRADYDRQQQLLKEHNIPIGAY